MIATVERDYRRALVVSDTLGLFAAIILTVGMRFYIAPFMHVTPPHLPVWWACRMGVVLLILWIFSLRNSGAYQLGASSLTESLAILKGTTLFTLLCLAFAFFKWTLFSRASVLIFMPTATVVV